MLLPTGSRRVAVVVPCLNESEPIRGVVRELLTQGVDDVVVVDNGSTDGTAQEAAAAGARVVSEPRRGYGRACAAGVASLPPETEIVCFVDGDGSDVPAFLPAVVAPVAAGAADFVMGSRLRGVREPGSMTPQQIVAGWLSGALLRLTYGVRFTDMSPFRAIRLDRLRALGMSEQTFGWNLEMQMRVAAAGWRILEIPVDHRRRRGGVSKVSGDFVAGMRAAWTIATTFLRLAISLRANPPRVAAGGVSEMKTLVTGGAGFIGQHVVRELLSRGHDVRVLDSLRADVHADRPWIPPAGVELQVGDVRTTTAVDRALAGVDAVLHLAAKVGLGVDVGDLPDYASSNDVGTAELLAGDGARRRGAPDAREFDGGLWRGRWTLRSTWRGESCAEKAKRPGGGPVRAALPLVRPAIDDRPRERKRAVGSAQCLRQQQGRAGVLLRQLGARDRRLGGRDALSQRLWPGHAA